MFNQVRNITIFISDPLVLKLLTCPRLNFSYLNERKFRHNSSVIRQKGESQNGCFKKAKHAKISKKQTFLIP